MKIYYFYAKYLVINENLLLLHKIFGYGRKNSNIKKVQFMGFQ